VKRAFTVLSCAAMLVALLPATTSAAGATRYSDQSAEASCDGSFDGGYASVFLFTSTQFDDGANADVWLDPAVPFEDPQTMSGFGSTVDRADGPTDVVLSATFTMFDTDGNELGDAVVTATMTPSGDPEVLEPSTDKTNFQSVTTGTIQPLEGTATLSLPGLADSELTCFGDASDTDVFQTNPHALVSSAQGVNIDCSWAVGDDTRAFFFGQQFGTSSFYGAGLTTPAVDWNGFGETPGAISPTSVNATIPLVETNTGDPGSAVATASFTTLGSPYTSTIIVQDGRTKTTEQALVAHGSIVFEPSGDSFEMDAEHCTASTFDAHSQANVSSGPKVGAASVNDTPDGAIHLTPNSKPSVLTGGTALEAEVPNLTCPDGDRDAMGHTVWYTVTGTGGPITIDTSGSDFDTVAAVFAPDGEGLTEIACDDDVVFVPIGTSYQAVVTFDSEAGVDYYVEVGGFANIFTGDAQSGRLRVTVR